MQYSEPFDVACMLSLHEPEVTFLVLVLSVGLHGLTIILTIVGHAKTTQRVKAVSYHVVLEQRL